MFWRDGSVMDAVKELMASKPSLSFAKAKDYVVGNSYRSRNHNQPHQGNGERARRARQLATGMLRTN